MSCIIDRFEDALAILEMADGTHVKLPRCLLPDNAREGDSISIQIDKEATEQRKKRIGSLMTELFEE